MGTMESDRKRINGPFLRKAGPKKTREGGVRGERGEGVIENLDPEI